MKNGRMLIRGIMAACAMLVIILDARTAAASAYSGIELCIRTVIPSLLPFFVLSGVINNCLLGQKLWFFQPLGRLCKIPKGTESLLILGFFAGYPVGAQLITQAYQDGKLPHKTARRMLGFCNNAGPAFLFGMLSPLFSSVKAVWLLWAVQILSALITGFILPSDPASAAEISPTGNLSFSESLQKALRAIAGVCGWVILFRIVLAFCNRLFLWSLPETTQILISGVLELTNGCVLLNNLPNEGMRFLLSGVLLSFGGLCVGMQTISVTDRLGTGWYFPGKVLQTSLTALLCLILQPIMFAKTEVVSVPPSTVIGLIVFLMVLILTLQRKKLWLF